MADPRIAARLQGAIDGQLPPAGQAWVNEHLAARPDTAADQAERAALAARLRVELAGIPAPALDADRRAAIRAAAAMPPPRIRRFRAWHAVLAAACLVLAAGAMHLASVQTAPAAIESLESPPVRIATMAPVQRSEQAPPMIPVPAAAFAGRTEDQRAALDGIETDMAKQILHGRSIHTDDDSDAPRPRAGGEAAASSEMGGMGAFMAVGGGGAGPNATPRTGTAARLRPPAPLPSVALRDAPSTQGQPAGQVEAAEKQGMAPSAAVGWVARDGELAKRPGMVPVEPRSSNGPSFPGPGIDLPLWQDASVPEPRKTELTHIAQVRGRGGAQVQIRRAEAEEDLTDRASVGQRDHDHQRRSESDQEKKEFYSRLIPIGDQPDLLSRLRQARTSGRQLVVQDGQVVERAPVPLDPTDLGGLSADAFAARWGVVPMLPVTVRADQTFALNADTALVDQVERLLANRTLPMPEMVRPEQFVNAMPANHPAPTAEPVALYAEAAPHPLLDDGRTLLVAVTAVTRAPVPGERRPLNLVVCLDVSGSMGGVAWDRAKDEIRSLIAKAGPQDRVALVTFADRGRVVVPAGAATPERCADLSRTLALIEPQATTDLVDGLRLAYQVAADGAAPERASAVLLLTDGATLAPALVDDAVAAVAAFRGRGIQLVAGVVGDEPAQPLAVQRLAERGDGRVVDLARSPLGLVPERLTALVADAKCQVVWNPERVAHARLVGYREHRLKAQDFRNDAVDAAEIAAAVRVTALFEIIPVEGGSGPFGTARVRFQDLRQQRIVEEALPLGGTILARRASPQLRLWAVAAATGEWLERGWWSNARGWTGKGLLAAVEQVREPGLSHGANRLHRLITAASPLLR
ncbi:MAG: hypothetical protein RLZZ127_873 [Planctomycetota bacterium]|jgi:Ca-activated chloride channel family protein